MVFFVDKRFQSMIGIGKGQVYKRIIQIFHKITSTYLMQKRGAGGNELRKRREPGEAGMIYSAMQENCLNERLYLCRATKNFEKRKIKKQPQQCVLLWP